MAKTGPFQMYQKSEKLITFELLSNVCTLAEGLAGRSFAMQKHFK